MSTRTVRGWERLCRDVLRATDWDYSVSPIETTPTPCITDYINFCVDIIPTRSVRCFPNKHPVITRELKELLKRRKRAFGDGDRMTDKRAEVAESEAEDVQGGIQMEAGEQAPAKHHERCVARYEGHHRVQGEGESGGRKPECTLH